MRISSGNSFVHETESQVILNGSRDISVTMDLVSKDIGLFQELADRCGVPVELSPILVEIFQGRRGRGTASREWSPNIVRRPRGRPPGLAILAPGFPTRMIDDEPEASGHEVVPKWAKLNDRCPRARTDPGQATVAHGCEDMAAASLGVARPPRR